MIRIWHLCIGGYESTGQNIYAEMPQCSVLVPLLFLLHNNDLQNNTNLRVLNFADDTLLYTTVNKTTYKKEITNLNVEIRKFRIGL